MFIRHSKQITTVHQSRESFKAEMKLQNITFTEKSLVEGRIYCFPFGNVFPGIYLRRNGVVTDGKHEARPSKIRIEYGAYISPTCSMSRFRS
jgi:hypothetical protein